MRLAGRGGRGRASGVGMVAAALGLALALASPAAAADEPAAPPAPAAPDTSAGPVSRAQISAELHGYYETERDTAFTFAGIGLASVGVGANLVTRGEDFSSGLGWSLVAVGALETLGSVFYALEVKREIGHYSAQLATDPARFKEEERAHIHGTATRFAYYRTGELVLAALGAGAAMYGFAADQDAWKGIGIGVAAEALTFFVLDSFGQARARAYEERLERFEPKLAVSPGGGDRPWAFTMTGRF